ncbi:MAG: hypothetical protein WBV89_00525, partial [Ilumatobacter sp.]
LGPVADVTPRPVPFVRRRLVEAVRVAAGAALIVAGLTADRRLLVPALVAGALMGVGPLSRLTPPGTLRGASGLPAAIASRGILTFAFFGLDAFVPFALTNGRGTSTLAGSIAVTVVTVSWTAGAWIQDRWIVRVGEAPFIRVGFVLLAGGIGAVAIASLPGVLPFWMIHVGGSCAGLGMGLAYAAHAQVTLRSAEESAVGVTTSSLQLSDNLGIALGTGVVGAIVTFGDQLGWLAGDAVAVGLLVPVAVAIGGAVLARRLPPPVHPGVAA